MAEDKIVRLETRPDTKVPFYDMKRAGRLRRSFCCQEEMADFVRQSMASRRALTSLCVPEIALPMFALT